MYNNNFNNSMQSRIRRSEGDYEKAKLAYSKAKENLKIYNDKNDNLTYDNLKECTNNLFQVVDAFLRYFCMKFSVPFSIKTKNNDENFVLTQENEGKYRLNTFEFCVAIVEYQKNTINQRIKDELSKIDFSSFINEKEYRNDIEHYTLISGMGDFYRVFYNLKLLINLVDDENDISLPVENELEFDFQGFRNCMARFDDTQSNFILICDSVHNVNADELSYFLQLPWRIIFDLDSLSEIGGVKKCIIQNKFDINDIPLSSLAAKNQVLPINRRPFYINLAQESNEVFARRSTVPNEGSKIRDFMEKIHSITIPNCYIVILAKNTKRIDKIIESIGEIVSEVELIYLTLQEFEKNRPLSPEENYFIKDTYYINGDFFSIFKAFAQNRTYLNNLLPNYISSNILRLPFNNTEISKFDKCQIEQKYGYDFEILHLDIGNYADGCREIEFFKGGIATWEIIKNKYARPLINDSKYRAFTTRIRQSLERKCNDRCYYILHKPGFGGTTLGRILAWDLHEDFTVIQLKKFSVQRTKILLESFYRTLGKVSFMVIIDENDFSESELNDLEKLAEDIEIPISTLFIKRTTESEYINISKLQNKHNGNQAQNKLLIGSIDEPMINELTTRCAGLLNDHDKFIERKKQLDDNIISEHKCPLIINLYILEEKFSLYNYVKRFLDLINNNTDGNTLKETLIYISLCDYYANCGFSAALVNEKMQVLRLQSDATARKKLSIVSELLLEKQDLNYGLLFKIKHYLISKEILNQLIYKDEVNEKFNVDLKNHCKEFINFTKKLCKNRVDEYLIKVLTGLFTDKTAARRDDNSEDYYGTHTKLINKLPNESQRFEVICHLESNFSEFIEENIPIDKGKKEYNFLAHIYAQCARIAARNDQTDTEVKKYCDKTARIIETVHITEPDLYHMIGMCYLDMANKLTTLSGDYENIAEIEKLYYDALEMFNQTIWLGSYNYGIPKKMQTITELLSIMFKIHNIDTVNDEKLDNYPKISTLIQEGISLIEEKNTNYDNLNDVALRTFLDSKTEFEKICFLKDSSSTIRILNNRLQELKKNNQRDNIVSIYTITNAIVYSYSKKYYNEFRKSSDLLIKAYQNEFKAVEDIKKVMEHLENVINLSEIQCASWAYKKWFSYSKFTGESLTKAKDMASRWLNSSKNNNDRIWIYYYLYITTFLLYVDENIGTENEVYSRRNDLRQELKNTRNQRLVRDWYTNGKGMAKLIERTVCDISNVLENDKVSVVEGKICSIEDKEGYIKITNPASFKRIGKPKIGSDFDKDSCVFFSPHRAEIFDSELTEEKKFKFGFSFERMEASSKTLQELNKPDREGEKTSVAINGVENSSKFNNEYLAIDEKLLILLNGNYDKCKIEKDTANVEINKIYEAKVVSVPFDNYENKYRIKLIIKDNFSEHEVSVNFFDIVGKKMHVKDYKNLLSMIVPVKIIKLATVYSPIIGSIKDALV